VADKTTKSQILYKKLSKEIKNLDQKKDPKLHTNKITKIVAEEEKRREILDKIKKKIRARNVWVDLLTKAMKDNR
jgi:RNA:NAD 2'-phosphotransferase (TPT1/KptA family)